jgi:hypothetical protein
MCHNLNLTCQGYFNGKKLKQLANSSNNQIDIEDIINELASESESESQDDSADESIINDYSLLVDVINDDDDSFTYSSDDLEIFEQLDDICIEVARLILKIRKLVKIVKNVSSISREFSKLIDENEETICSNFRL